MIFQMTGFKPVDLWYWKRHICQLSHSPLTRSFYFAVFNRLRMLVGVVYDSEMLCAYENGIGDVLLVVLPTCH